LEGGGKRQWGHCLVNWPTVTRPKDLGGLGVPDLDKFGRALRLRWLWLQWTDSSRPWTGTDVPCNREDRLLFQASTLITIGDGNKARFLDRCLARWRSPHEPRPQPFSYGGKKRKISDKELQNNNWVSRLRSRINTAEQVEEFISFGLESRQFSYKRASMTVSLGDGRQMDPTRPDQHTEYNSRAPTALSTPI